MQISGFEWLLDTVCITVSNGSFMAACFALKSRADPYSLRQPPHPHVGLHQETPQGIPWGNA